MNTVFESDNFSLYNGNCLEVLADLPESSVDLVFADPPYFLSNNGITWGSGKMVSVNKGDWDVSQGNDQDYAFHYDWIAACRRVLKPNGTIWISGTHHSIYHCGAALLAQGWHIINDICWFKPCAAPNMMCRNFTHSHETLIWAKKSASAKHYFAYEVMRNGDWGNDFLKAPGKQMRSVWAIYPPQDREKAFGQHPTQKPLALLHRILLASIPTGEGTVLDPFCGSGTTGVAAVMHGSQFLGIDQDSGYIKNIALPRIRTTAATSNTLLKLLATA